MTGDRFAAARQVADAVLYEGYVLYPYRASAQKNQLRWQFGVLAPRPYAERERSEAWTMRGECLVETGRARSAAHVRVRCLQLRSRLVEELIDPSEAAGDERRFAAVARLEVDEQLYTTWDEAVEHELECPPAFLDDLLAGGGAITTIELAAGSEDEVLVSRSGVEAGRLTRQTWPVRGRIVVTAEEAGPSFVKMSASVENLTDWDEPGASRDDVVRRSLVAVHILVALEDGSFVSLIDPPVRAAAAVAGCKSTGCFPVLCGPESRRDLVLCSPIILYDHPEIAPESPGDMCDSTEIDEILALRTLTLTEEEKREARATDGRSAAIIDRVDDMPREIFERLHGAIRSLRPAVSANAARGDQVGAPELIDFPTIGAGPAAEVRPAGAERPTVPWWDPGVDASVDPASDTISIGHHDVGRGARVRLHPGRRSDAQDIFLVGRLATVAGVFQDVDGDVHLAVTLDDDPAAEMHEWYGRYRYFHPEELEVVEASK